MKFFSILLALAIAAGAAPLAARESNLAVPAGRLSDVAIAVARATGTSIVIADPDLARRRVPGLRGRMNGSEAVRRIARANRLRAVPVGRGAWRLVAQQERRRPVRKRAPPPPAPPPVQPARAEPLPPVEVEPIVVIASKRDLRVDELAAQVSILDGERLERGGIGGTEKLTQRIATVSSTYLGSGRNKLFIRGIADSSFTGPTQATVGQYLGDLRLSYNAPDPDLRLSDMERVEILEGPQGTLYGAGSLGGIIRLVPRAPELGEASLNAVTGRSFVRQGQPGADVHATLNLPLVQESAALRVNFDMLSQGGYIDKPHLGRRDVNDTRIVAGRAALRVSLAPGWSMDVLGVGQSTRADDSQYADRKGAPLESSARVQEGASADYGQAQIVLTGRIGSLRLRSSTGIAGQELLERYDATAPGAEPLLFVQQNDTQMVANETRLWQPLDHRLGWLAGVSFVDNQTRLTRSLVSRDALMRTTGVLNTVQELTGYGEASLRLFEPVILSAGARLTHARLGGSGEDIARLLSAADAAITASRSETAFLPSAALLVQPAADVRLYVRYQEGFRPGGLAIADDFVRQFRSDRTRTVEFGFGIGNPGRGDFDLSANVSHTDWHDIQADFIDSTGLPTTANIGNGTILTASVAGGLELAPELRLEAGASFNDSRVDEPVIVALDRITQIPNIARFSGRLGLSWQRQFASGLTLDAEGWASYIGKSRLGVGPELGELQGDYLDSGLLLRFGRERVGVTASLTNIADVEGNRFALGTPLAIGRQQVTPLAPRTFRIGLDARF